MLLATWPAVLPQSVPPDSTITTEKNYVETEMDAGPKKRRKRFTAVSRYIEVPNRWLFSDAQWAAFDFFYTETLGGGSLSFQWNNPMPGLGLVTVRFHDDPPKVTVLKATKPGRYAYQVACQFEVLP